MNYSINAKMKKPNKKAISTAAVAVLVCFFTASPASASFVDYVIRASGSGVAPTINYPAADQYEFIVNQSSQKAALGSNDINGKTIGDITSLYIERLDDTGSYAAGSGPAVAPYFNIWITDGAGKFAVVANEPSNGAFQSLFETNGAGDKFYDLSFSDLADKTAKIYETSDTSWLPAGTLTFADLAAYAILAPTVDQLNTGWAGLGGGAPRELGTNIAYGVNWVFGDTLSNYVSGNDGYIVANASIAAAAVPLPAAIWLFAPTLVLFGWLKRKSFRVRTRTALAAA